VRRATIFLLCCCATLLALAPAASAKRVALVIGIDSYDNLTRDQQLKKAVNDAQTLGDALRALGYEVVAAKNADRRGFNETWQKFLSRVDPGDEVAFFFAGHGIEIGGQNYLLPRDIPKPQSGEASLVKNEALSITQLLADLQEEAPRVSLIILDACRDNPFAAGGVRSVGGTRGLARVEAPEGTFVMYSAGTGQTALDRLSDNDDDANSVFTRSLVPLIRTKGLGLQEVALKVREEVVALATSAGHKQTPAYYDQVVGRFCVAGCETEIAAATPAPDTQPKALAALPKAAPAVPEVPPAPEPRSSSAPASGDVAALAPQNLESLPDGASASSGELIRGIETPSLVWSVAFSPDGTLIATGEHDHNIRLWDVATGQLSKTLEGHAAEVRSVVFSSDGALIASASQDHNVGLWDVKSRKLKRMLKGHTDEVTSVVFSPDDTQLASGSADNTVRLWNVSGGKFLRSFTGQSYTVVGVAFSPDGRRLASSGWNDGVTVWDAATGEKLSSLSAFPNYVDEMAFSPDWLKAATATNKLVKLWDVASGELLHTLEHGTEDVDDLRFSPDGVLLASADEKAVKLWDAASGGLRLGIKDPSYVVTSVAFSPDGSMLAVAGGDIKLFDIRGPATARR